MDKILCTGLNSSAKIAFEKAKEKGFWDKERNVGEMLMLIVSELGEAMEAHRKGKFSSENVVNTLYDYNKNTISFKEHFEMTIKDTFEDEIADAFIRLLDLVGGLNIDIEKHINLKVKYNSTREKFHGKKY